MIATSDADRIARNEALMRWVKADIALIDDDAYYLVKHNGREWRDFDLCVLRGIMVRHRLGRDYVRGRPEYVARITKPVEGD